MMMMTIMMTTMLNMITLIIGHDKSVVFGRVECSFLFSIINASNDDADNNNDNDADADDVHR